VFDVPAVAPPESPGEVPLDPVPEPHPNMLKARISVEAASESRYSISRKFFIGLSYGAEFRVCW
jgi:hypothetical protein